jgi:hypothetical protein
VLPLDSPRNELQLGPFNLTFDVEWLCPDPRWRGVEEQHVTLRAGGGFHGPFSGPFWSLGGNVEVEVDNVGTAAAPLLVRLYGPATTPQLELVGHDGVRLKVRDGVTIADGDHLAIDTSFITRSVRLHRANGSVEPGAHLLDIGQSQFFSLPRGGSTLRLSGDELSQGSAVVSWRPHYSGV